jgi:hypothetical protein
MGGIQYPSLFDLSQIILLQRLSALRVVQLPLGR